MRRTGQRASKLRAMGCALASALLVIGAAACVLDREGSALARGGGGDGGSAGGGAEGGVEGGGGGAAGMGGSEGGSGGAPNPCGDHVVDPGEACDDGNDVAGDGCAACAVEAGFSCGGEPNACVPIEMTVSAGPGLALVITDLANHYTGNLSTMDCVTLAHDGSPATQIEEVRVEVGIDHAFAGDVILKLVSPAGTTLTLVNRPGAAEPADAYAENPNGDSSGLVSTSPIRFNDGGPTDAEAMGAMLSDAQVICADDLLCDFAPNPGKGPGEGFSDFIGEPPAGDWRLCAADGDNVDQGTIDRVAVTVRATFP